MLDLAYSRKDLLTLKDSLQVFILEAARWIWHYSVLLVSSELTLTRTRVTTAISIYLPTSTVFRSSPVAPVVAVYLIYSIILWSVTVRSRLASYWKLLSCFTKQSPMDNNSTMLYKQPCGCSAVNTTGRKNGFAHICSWQKCGKNAKTEF